VTHVVMTTNDGCAQGADFAKFGPFTDSGPSCHAWRIRAL